MSGLRYEYQAHDSDNESNIIRESGEDDSETADSSVDTTSEKNTENGSNEDANSFNEEDGDVSIFPEATTENGAPSLSTTLDARLDLFFKTVRDIGNLSLLIPKIKKIDSTNQERPQTPRGINTGSEETTQPITDNSNLYKLIDASLAIDPLDTLKILFNWRDCRGGKGDYDGFLVAINYLLTNQPHIILHNIKHIPEYGSYLDLVKLWTTIANDRIQSNYIMQIIVDQLKIDKQLLETGDENEKKKISLLAKWIPSENAHWDHMAVVDRNPAAPKSPKPRFCINLCRLLFCEPNPKAIHLKKLRKEYLVPLRTHLRIVEHNLSAKTYSEINYQSVPSLAMKKYRGAFIRHDAERFTEYLRLVKSGKVKINASQVYPHDLVRHYLNGAIDIAEDSVIEEQWKVIAEKVRSLGVFDNSLVVCDVSGSMNGTPMEVAIALGILGMNNRRLITFSADPQIHTVIGETLREKVASVSNMDWGMNTDFGKVCELILSLEDTTITKIFIFSDMQFDVAIRNGDSNHFEFLKRRFENIGRVMPTIIFWNLRGQTTDFPVRSNEDGVVMLSGYSPSLMTALLGGEEITPLNIMLKTIRAPRYDAITL